MSNSEPGSTANTPRVSIVATVAAAIIVIIYLALVVSLWGQVDAKDTSWERRQALLTPLEALAFTAAGVLLGTTVQRQVTEKVEDRARDAEATATANQRDAEKGRALHRAIDARAGHAASPAGDRVRGVPLEAAGDPLADLAALARQYDEP
jgi:hypothetical protein